MKLSLTETRSATYQPWTVFTAAGFVKVFPQVGMASVWLVVEQIDGEHWYSGLVRDRRSPAYDTSDAAVQWIAAQQATT
jgi:hypothetical protein